MAHTPDMALLADRVAAVRFHMAQAAAQAGRRPDEIKLCAACKSRSSEEVRLSAGLEIDLFGENRMQELAAHMADGAYLGKPCHFIGHLQTNKVRRVVGQAAIIESVSSIRLLSAIAAEARKQGIVQDILFEINIGEEDSKMGASAEALWPMMDDAASLPSVRLRGLMAIPPAFDNSPESRRWFAMMRALFEKARARHPGSAHLDTLSMGMTGSYIAAIEEGATLIRVGTGIYGERS
ncbi:MAG: YggS family pyridoxal phosphate-dependent enzyme [Eubacteriales bacterium]|nr:YggS family pyridoxal phosphate-dependent enzyme [Eubacteriales bacterium]MDD4134902.1 YggS family pyridoxal phosphate-dependent enzyme [Eubacteriales bacterium]NLO12515.1 YggS family pyridoxal phosphate-dependent enzyme [Clostridiales bacterium]